MKLNQKLIKQLRNGEIAVENNGTLEQLRVVIKKAFPGSIMVSGFSECYKGACSECDDSRWIGAPISKCRLKIVPISDFYQPELFTGWAKDDKHPKWMVYFKDDVAEFGFDAANYWCDRLNTRCRNYSEDSYSREATHEEIESTLRQEAIRRGFKEGVRFRNLNGSIQTIYKTNHWYEENSNSLLCGRTPENEWMEFNCNSNPYLFKDGKWAEIVEEPAQVKKESNPIHYTVEDTVYSLDYQGLKAAYNNASTYTDKEFMKCLPQIAHLACIISTLKGLGTQATIGDKGIIHELIHLMTEPNEPTNDLGEIREKFNRLIKLS